jgi:hypothetical protein
MKYASFPMILADRRYHGLILLSRFYRKLERQATKRRPTERRGEQPVAKTDVSNTRYHSN